MDQHGFKNALITAIRTNADLEVWSNANYGRGVRVFVGVDEDKLPGESDCPYVEIIGPGKHTGPATNEKQYQFGVIVAIYDDSKIDHGDTMIEEHAGVNRVEEFRAMIQGLVVESLPGNAEIGELLVNNEAVEQFPFFQSAMSLIVNETHVCGTGADPYE